MSKPYDAIVLGLGAMGSAAVYQLAKRGKRVLGIDQFAPPHHLGSTHGDTRITRLAIGEGEDYVPLVMRSHQLWREIEQATGRDLLTITGGLIMASQRSRSKTHGSSTFLQTTIAAAEKYGIAHELLDTQQIRQRFPQFQLVGDEQGYYEQHAGFVRPERCIEAQLALARQHGATLQTNEGVLEYRPTSDGVTVKSEHGSYTAEKLIISAGAWITHLLEPELARFFTIYRQVLYWFGVKGEIAPFLSGRFPIFIWEREDTDIYGFPAIDGSAGGVKVATEQYAVATTPETVDRSVSEEETRQMYATHIARYLPGLRETCVKAIACLYTSTPDGCFVLDTHPKHPQIIIASPCSGHGFKHSAAIGEALAQMVSDGKSQIDLSSFSLRRFLGGA
jgi:sarcosine oxidase